MTNRTVSMPTENSITAAVQYGLRKGHYTVTASITDETGREYRYDAKTDIYSVPQIGFEVPENTHTDINTEIKTNIIEADGLDIVWKISKDNGEFKELADGTIQNEGGTIRFKDKGSYILKASVTDSFGRVFEYSSEIIKVYPVPEVDFQQTAERNILCRCTGIRIKHNGYSESKRAWKP